MKNKFESSDDFNTLALKLRMQRYDRETVEKLKLDAVNFEREKNRKRKAIIKIQKFYRGSHSRKLFRSMIDDINTNIVIDYIRAKRKEKIRANPEIIISYYLNRYIQKKRDVKRMILFDYLNFCSNLIKKNYIGFRLRKNFIPKLNSYRKCVSKISDFLNSFKIRLILRSKKFQDYLVEISNIKSCLLTLMSDDRNSDKTEKLKRDFMKRLPRLQRNFYEEFYKLKYNRKWVIYPKIDKKWLHSYMNILQTVNMQQINIFDENPNTSKKSPQMKQKEIESQDILSISEEKFPVKKFTLEQPNEENNYNEEKNDEIIKEECYRENPKGINCNLDENPNNNPENLDENYDNYNKRNDTDYKNHENNMDYGNQAQLDYDDRPIKVNPQKVYDYYKMMEETPIEGEINENKNKSPKKIKAKVNKIRRKVPKYDARKAIEESKNNNQNESINQNNDRNNFREFLKKIKDEKNADKKSIDNTDLNDARMDSNKDEIQTKSAKKENKNKKEIKLKEHYNTEAGIIETIPLDQFTSTNLKNEDKTRRKKVVSNEINLRRKLHELEKSPPPRIDVKSIKSKIDCWTNDNEPSNKKAKRNQLIIEQIPNLNKRYGFLERISGDYHSINLELPDYLRKKAENMKEFSEIPYIKMDSFYIKHYSNEIYEQLLMHLNKHYEELKN